MTRRTKLTVLTVPALLVLVSAVVLICGYLRPTTAERPVAIANYVASESLDCEVYLHPNDLYDTPSIGPDQKIFSQLVDHIDGKLHYSFAADASRDVTISGNYTIVADVKTDDWSKRLVIKPPTPLTSNRTAVRLDENFTLDMAAWNAIVATIGSETGVTPRNPSTIITATVEATLSAGDKVKPTTMSATMEVPLRLTSYNIAITNPPNQNGSVTVPGTVVQRSVQDQRKYSLTAMLVGMFLSLGAVMLIRRVPTRRNDADARTAVRETIKKKRKKYKDRLVEVAQIVQPPFSTTTVAASSLDELVKIADELGKPVMFTDSDDSSEPPIYCVLDGPVCYQWMPFARQTGKTTPTPDRTGKSPG